MRRHAWKVAILAVVLGVVLPLTSAEAATHGKLITYGPVSARFSVNFPVPPKTGPADLSASPAGSTGIDYWTGTPKDPYGPSGNDVSPANAVSDSVDVEHYPSVADANLVFNDIKAISTSYAKYTPMPSVPADASARGLERATNNQGQPGAAEVEFIQLGATTFSLGSNNPNGLAAARAFTNSFVLVSGGTGGATHPTYPLGSAKSCKVHYVERILSHKVKGKTVSYIGCVYEPPKAKPKPAPTTTTVPPTTTTTTTPLVQTTTTVGIAGVGVDLGASPSVSGAGLGNPALGTLTITMIDTATGQTIGSWTNTGAYSSLITQPGIVWVLSTASLPATTYTLTVGTADGSYWSGPAAVTISAADFVGSYIGVTATFAGMPGFAPSTSKTVPF
jgi:hypothetical protein